MKYRVSIGQVQYHQKIRTIEAKSPEEAEWIVLEMMEHDLDDINVWSFDTETDHDTTIRVETRCEVDGEECGHCGAALLDLADNQITAVCPVCGRTARVCCNCPENIANNPVCDECPYAKMSGNNYIEDEED